jgi:polar amino acid transport system substrate-binding protein
MKRRTFLAGSLAMVALGKGAAADRNLVLASNEVYPLLYRAEGNLTGFLFDVITEAARRAEIPAEIRVMPWARCIEEARNGEIDGVFVTFRTAERLPYLSFPAEPLMAQRICFFTRHDSPIRYGGKLEDLAPYRIGVANKVSYGPAFDAAVRDGVLPSIEPANGLESLVRMLLASRIDLFVLHDLEAIGLVKRLGLSGEVKMLAPPLDEVPGYIAFTRQRDLSAEIAGFDTSLARMRHDGFYKRLYDAYFL